MGEAEQRKTAEPCSLPSRESAFYDGGKVVDDMERILNFRPHARLEFLQFLEHVSGRRGLAP